MDCPACGAGNAANAHACGACGGPLPPRAAATRAEDLPEAARLVARLPGLGVGVMGLVVVREGMRVTQDALDSLFVLALLPLGSFILLLGALLLVLAVFAWLRRTWAALLALTAGTLVLLFGLLVLAAGNDAALPLVATGGAASLPFLWRDARRACGF